MLKPNEIELLKKAVGSWVRLVNCADVDMDDSGIQIHVHGKLCQDDENDQGFSVCAEDFYGNGTNSVSFQVRHLDSVFRQPSGIIEITLK